LSNLAKPQIRPTVAQIDLAALQRNYERVVGRIPGGTEVLAAVKADAYGHGAVRVALALQDVGCGWFGVAMVEEGRRLREAGVTGRIIVLSGSGRSGAGTALERDLTPVVFDLDVARRLDAAAAERGRALPVHVKVDTGMGRLGVPWRDWRSFVEQLAQLRWLQVEGLMSHLASAESDELLTARQRQRFETAIDEAREVGLNPSVQHIANTAGLLVDSALGYGLVRPGIALYGASAGGGLTDDLGLEPVMTVRTRVLHVKAIEAGEGVSYGQTWVAPRPSRIAWLPVGYADGYPRSLSDKAHVLVHGQRAPVRGRICMDLTAIDVTDIAGVEQGDEVVLIGRQGEATVSAEELAGHADTIAYEILCSFSARVPRRHLISFPSVRPT